MKNIIFILILLFNFSISPLCGQTLSYTKVNDQDLVYILNNIENTITYSSDTSNLLVRVYFVGDPSGSAGFDNCDITNSIYVAVSEYGEAPDQNVFRLSSVYDPRFIKWIPSKNEPGFVLTYNVNGKRKKVTIKVTLNKLTISKESSLH